MVDRWVQIEEDRLRYLQWAQCFDRVEQEDALDTYLALTQSPDMSIPGSLCFFPRDILPGSFIADSWFMQQK